MAIRVRSGEHSDTITFNKHLRWFCCRELRKHFEKHRMKGNDFKAKCPQGVCLPHIIQKYKWKETGRAREKESRVN